MKLLPILAFALAGCMSSPGPQRLATSHPAHPDAEQVRFEGERSELLAITNSVTTPKPANSGAQGKHEHHE
jgi:hypothetical protein